MPAGKQAGTGDPTREGTTTDRAPERATTETAPRRRVSFFFSFLSLPETTRDASGFER